MKHMKKRLLALLLVFALTFGEIAPAFTLFAEEALPPDVGSAVQQDDPVPDEPVIEDPVLEEPVPEEPLVEDPVPESGLEEGLQVGFSLEPPGSGVITSVEDLPWLYDAEGDQSGPGWEWDHETSTLTLTDFKVDLSAYAGEVDIISLPYNAGATIVLAGTSNVIVGNPGCNGIYTESPLTITGSAPLSISNVIRGIVNDESYVELKGVTMDIAVAPECVGEEHCYTVCSFGEKIRLKGGSVIATPNVEIAEFDGVTYFAAAGTTDAVGAVSIAVSDDPYLDWTAEPTNAAAKVSDAPISYTFTAQAQLFNAEGEVSYQWYSCADKSGTDAAPISGATAPTLQVTEEKAAGRYYFFCVATYGGTLEITSCVAALSVNKAGKLVIDRIDLSKTQDRIATEGWAWDAETLTLTLDGIMFEAEGAAGHNVGYIGFPESERPITIKLAEGSENTITSGDVYLLDVYAPTLFITGPGELYVRNVATTGQDAVWTDGDLTVTNGAQVTLVNGGVRGQALEVIGDLTVTDTARLYLEREQEENVDRFACALTLEGEAFFTVEDPEGAVISDYRLCKDGAPVRCATLVAAPPTVVFTDYPEDTLYFGKGEAATVTAAAQVAAWSGATPVISYKWYNSSGTAVASTASFKIPTTANGQKTYYCVATATVDGKKISATGELITVNVGKAIRTETLTIKGSTATTDMLGTQGWKWDEDTYTLTLDGIILNVADGEGIKFDSLPASAEVTVRLAEGSHNVINAAGDGIYITGVKKLTIAGAGTLDITNDSRGIAAQATSGGLTVAEKAQVRVENTRFSTLDVNSGPLKVELGSRLECVATGSASGTYFGWLGDNTTVLSPEGAYVANYSAAKTVYNADDSRAKEVVFAGTPDINFTQYPADTHVEAGKSVTLTAKAVAEGGLAVKYEWFNGEDEKVSSAASYKFTPQAKQGAQTYYCVASVTVNGVTYTKRGEDISLTCGVQTLTSRINITHTTASQDNLAKYGWAWDANTRTLTLKNIDLQPISGDPVTLSGFSSGTTITVKLLGDNNIRSGIYNADAFYAYGMNVVFTGGGKLTTTVGANGVEARSVVVKDNCDITMVSTDATYGFPLYVNTFNVEGKNTRLHLVSHEDLSIMHSYPVDNEYMLKRFTSEVIEPEGVVYNASQRTFTDSEGNPLTDATFATKSFYVSTWPDEIYTMNVGGKVTLKPTVVNTSGKAVTWAWYKTTSFGSDYTDYGVKVGSSASLAVTGKARGIEYYYFVVSCAGYTYTSDPIAVVTGTKGAHLITEKIYISDGDAAITVDNLASKGWKWDGDTRTLILENVDILIPFVSYGDYARFPGNLEVRGTNYAANGDMYLYPAVNGEDFVISGGGTLYMGQFADSGLGSDGVFTITGGTTVEMEKVDMDPEILVDGATLRLGGEYNYCYNAVTLKNGALLQAANELLVYFGDITVGAGSKLLCANELTTNSCVTVEAGGLLAANYLDMQLGGGDTSRVLTVNGSLHLTPVSGPPMFMYSVTNPSIVLGSGVSILQPGVTPKNNDVGYNYFMNSEAQIYKGELTVTDGQLNVKTVTAIGKITGTAKYGSTLKAGATNPASATVSYTWQWSDTADGRWNDIKTDIVPTFDVTTKYAGKYLRVVARGYGEYNGEAASAPIGPVVGDPNTLMGLYLDTMSMDTPFDGDYTGPFNASTDSWPASHTFTAVPVNEKAKVSYTLVNSEHPEGITFDGRIAAMNFVVGENKVTVTVVNGTSVREYVCNVNAYQRYGDILLERDDAYGLIIVAASWVDEEGNEQSATIPDGETQFRIEDIPYGTEVLITSTDPDGHAAYIYADAGLFGDYTKDGNPATYTVNRPYERIYVYDGLLYPTAPELSVKRHAHEPSFAQIEVTPLRMLDDSDWYDVLYKVYDEEGNIVVEGTLEDGADSITLNSLDPDKSYTVEARFNAYGNDRIVEMATATATLEPYREVTIVPASDYIVMKPGETYLLDVDYNGYYYGIWYVDSVSDTEVLDEYQTCASDVDGERVLQIKALAEGTAYITLKGDNAGYATLRVDVSADETAAGLRMGVTSGTLNVYDDSAILVPVYQMNCGHEITSAAFLDPAVDARFAVEVVNDRTLRVVPKVPEDADDMNWANWAKSLVGTYQSRIIVHYNGASSLTTSELLTIKATAKAPAVKVAAVKFNSFFTGDTQNFPFTIKDETVVLAKVDETKATAKTPAIPAWLTLGENGMSARINNSLLSNNKGSGKVYLKVWLEGWRVPANVTVSVSAAYIAPKLKLSASTVTIPASDALSGQFYLNLLSADKKVALTDLNITSVRTATAADLAAMSASERKTYAASTAYGVQNYIGSGSIQLAGLGNARPAGKILLIVTLNNDPAQTVRLPLTVKTQAAPTLKLSASSVSLYTAMGVGRDVRMVNLTCSALGATYMDDLTYTVTDSKGIQNLASHLDIDTDSSGEITVRTTAATVPGTTYKVTFSAEGTAKPVSLTVKTIATAPKLKASATTLNFNYAKGAYHDSAELFFSFTEKAYTDNIAYGDISYAVYLADGVTPVPDGYFSLWNGTAKLDISMGSAPVGTYKMKVWATLHDGVTQTAPITITLKVASKLPTVKASVTNATLYAAAQMHDLDSFDVTLTGLEGFATNSTQYELRDSKNKVIPDVSIYDYFEFSSAGNDFTVSAADDIAAGTYKIYIYRNLVCGLQCKPVIITVKVVDTVTGSASVKGNIDTTRPEATAADYTLKFNGWNPADYDNGVNTIYLPTLTWEVYAKNGKTVLTTADGALNDEGLVAKGVDGWLQDDSWFTNVSDRPYDVDLAIDQTSEAWWNDEISAKYTYTVRFKLRFTHVSNGTVTFKDVKLTLKQGATKFYQSTKTVEMPILDANARRYVVIRSSDKDAANVAAIERVQLVSSTVANLLEVEHLAGDIYAISWKNGTPPLAKISGTVKLNIFLEGNSGEKANATVSLTVKAQ